jgi:hypothetical protein
MQRLYICMHKRMYVHMYLFWFFRWPGDLTDGRGIGATVATDPLLPLSTEVRFKNLFLRTSAEDSLRLVFAEVVELVIVESRLAQGSDLEQNSKLQY